MSPVVAKNMRYHKEELIVGDLSNAEAISSLILDVLRLGDKNYRKLCEDGIKVIEHTAQKNNERVKQVFENEVV